MFPGRPGNDTPNFLVILILVFPAVAGHFCGGLYYANALGLALPSKFGAVLL